MNSFDFNGADPQRAMGDLIPDGTVCVVVASLRPGQEGPGGWLKANNDRNCLMADFEFTIDGGEFDRRKFWSLFVTEGQTEGQEKAAAITRSRLRGMLESAFGINPGDDSPAAMQKRQVAGWEAFDGLKFCARIGIEAGKVKNVATGEKYADKNVLKAAVTPDDPDYIAVGPQTGHFQQAGAVAAKDAAQAGAKASAKPSWAA